MRSCCAPGEGAGRAPDAASLRARTQDTLGGASKSERRPALVARPVSCSVIVKRAAAHG
jgi:hypothetical protein